MAGELRRHPQELPYAPRWLHSLLPGHSPLYDEMPWITFRAIDWLDAYLKPDMNVFEYGAGGSTLYLAKRVRNVISVEHDESFHQLVSNILSKRTIRNCQLMLHKAEPCEESGRDFASYQGKYQGLCFESYVKAIDAYPDRSFDLVLVDGRARMACVKRALAKIKPGGAMMLDNSDRPSYAQASGLMGDIPRLDLAGVTPWNIEVSQTSVWQIPT
jgi:predicted O-methyltransferase YrrM